MSAPRQKWLRGLQSSSLFRPPPQNSNLEHEAEISAYLELFVQFASESFVDDIAELVRSHYPSQENCLLDNVLATFVLHHPEHGHAVLHALLSCVIDGTIVYEKKAPPFRAFVALFSPSTERDFSEQWALACGEILRVLTHYNRPTFKAGNGQTSGTHASPSTSGEGSGKGSQEDSAWEDRGRKSQARLLTPWITDSLLAASPAIRNDYFRWCGGIMGKYAAGEELRPPTTVGHRKQAQLLPSTPRWAVASGAAVILSVCNDEVAHYETADLTASAVPALLIRPPPPTFQDDHPVVLGLPPLEPYAQLFQRYYSIATPGATCRLLLGLLETPPAAASQGFLVAVALMDILRVADGCSPLVQLPRNWRYIHFLKPAGTAMATKPGIVADAAAALLFYIFSQPALLLPSSSLSHGVSTSQSLYRSATLTSGTEERKAAATQASEDETAQSLAALMVGHGPDVEWRICALWEAALGLQTLSPLLMYLPKLVLSITLQPPRLSWNLMRPLLRILEYLPPKSESWDCLRRIFNATVEAILQRTFPREEIRKRKGGSQSVSQAGEGGTGAKVGMAELRAMVHCLFADSFLSPNLAAQLLSDALTICLSHDAKREIEFRGALRNSKEESSLSFEGSRASNVKDVHRSSGEEAQKYRGAAATFDSYVVAAVCALACEVRLLSFSPAYFSVAKPVTVATSRVENKGHVGSSGLQHGQSSLGASPSGFHIGAAGLVEHTKKLGLVELLLAGSPTFAVSRTTDFTSTSNILGESVVAAHMSGLLGQSRACLHSLTEIMKCEWDPGLCAQAAAVVARIARNGDLVSGASNGRTWRVTADCAQPLETKGQLDLVVREVDQTAKTPSQDLLKDDTLQKSSPNRNRGTNVLSGHRQKSANGVVRGDMGKQVAVLPFEAVDVAALLCEDRWNGHNAVVTASLRPVIFEKQHLAIGSVALLFQRLVFSPEISNSSEGTSGWHQVVEALCNMTAALPEKVAPFIVAQAETQLQPWTGKDDLQSQKSVWRMNTRIVTLLSALLRLRHIPYVVKVVVQDCALLRRATDGLTIDGEACTLPQLELLEAVSVAAQAALKWDEPDEETSDYLLELLKERLPATVRCLSNSSADVRAMSIARLRDTLYFESSKSRQSKEGFDADDPKDDEDLGGGYWRTAVRQCVAWEVHYRRAGGMSICLLANAANTLGCSIPS